MAKKLNFNNKVENNGSSERGKLTADEFNQVVNTINEINDEVSDIEIYAQNLANSSNCVDYVGNTLNPREFAINSIFSEVKLGLHPNVGDKVSARIELPVGAKIEVWLHEPPFASNMGNKQVSDTFTLTPENNSAILTVTQPVTTAVSVRFKTVDNPRTGTNLMVVAGSKMIADWLPSMDDVVTTISPEYIDEQFADWENESSLSKPLMILSDNDEPQQVYYEKTK